MVNLHIKKEYLQKTQPRITNLLQRAINGTRTRDPRLGKPMLYQLSYYRKSDAKLNFLL